MPLWGFILCFVIATLWAASPIMVARGQSLSNCTSNEINPIRSISFFTVALLFTLCYTGGSIPFITSPRVFVFLALNVFLSYMVGDILYFMAIKEIGISLAVPVSNTHPMLVALTAWLILGERMTLQILAGILIVMVGLLLLRFGGALKSGGESSVSIGSLSSAKIMRGFLMAIGAAVSWALSAPLVKLAMVESGLGAVEITFYRALIFLFLSWGWRFAAEKRTPSSVKPFSSLNRTTVLYFLGAALIGLWLGSVLHAICIAAMPVAIVTAITATSPFMAALFGHFALKERLTPVQWAGVAMIIAGSVTISV
ncbi:MAG: DMT family transporter [Synergistaceae bacterium]